MRGGIWKNSLPSIYRRFLEASSVWRFPKTHSTSQRQGQFWQVDSKAPMVSSWNLSQGWNVRSRPRREDLMHKMQVRQPERHDECNLSQGSAIYHNGITGNKQNREVDGIDWDSLCMKLLWNMPRKLHVTCSDFQRVFYWWNRAVHF